MSPHTRLAPFVLLFAVLFFSPGHLESRTPGSDRRPPVSIQPSILQDYVAWQSMKDATVTLEAGRSGKEFAEYSEQDYAAFMKRLHLDRDEDRWTWSHVTGIPIIVLRKGSKFFLANAHLLADAAVADRMSADELSDIQSEFDIKSNSLSLLSADDRPLPTRDVAAGVIRVLTRTGQVLHNEGFSEDRMDLDVLGPYLARFDELAYSAEVRKGIRMLPLSVVRVLRGKALYLSTRQGEGYEAIWHYVGSDRYPGYAGMQPGVFLEGRADGTTSGTLVRGVGRIIRETVLEGRYFGLYAHPLQFPEFQELSAERRRVFGRRRDRLPRSGYGYISTAAQQSPTDNFVEHFHAYIDDKELFRSRATRQTTQGHAELQEKFEFMETLVERTPTTMHRLSREYLARTDPVRQRKILQEYLTNAVQGSSRVARFRKEFGKLFVDLTVEDYAAFMGTLDLSRDDDLWTWSAVTDIPIVALDQRSNFFHMNAHLLADVKAASLMSWAELNEIRTTFDRATGELQLVAGDVRLRIRELPEDVIQLTDTTGGVAHNRNFSDDRLFYEVLEPWLLRPGDLENLQELTEGIRLLPLSVVKAHRGKALYPTNRSRTGWAVTWRVSNDKKLSYIGMWSGSFIEARRDPQRAANGVADLVRDNLGSLRGSSADSLVHEVAHIIDHSVIGGRPDAASFPYQFPEFQAMLAEKNRLFGNGDSQVPRTAHGYISEYAKTNAQENFAEHFWAYLRDRDAFLARALEEQEAGHAELVQKFRFAEKLIERTSPAMRRLSQDSLLDRDRHQQLERNDRQHEIMAGYVARQQGKEAAIATVERSFGRKFSAFSEADYARFMKGIDLTDDDDTWTWSHVTGITILGLSEKSMFFYSNAHLLEDVQAAVTMPLGDVIKLERGYDFTRNRPTVRTPSGKALRLRDIPAGTIRRSVRTGKFSHDENYAEPRIVLEVLAPFLVPLDEIMNRPAIADGLRALPLSIVKACRGKAIYLTIHPGRSYTVGMPVSNTTYKAFAGMQSGVFLDQAGSARTTHNLVHELGHVIDYTVISGRYGSYVHTYQFPEFLELLDEKERTFGKGDDKVPGTDHGYISNYARVNAQESFAEHFAWYILQKDSFRELAEEQQSADHPELMNKYRFLEVLLDRTPVTTQRLSRKFLDSLEATNVRQ